MTFCILAGSYWSWGNSITNTWKKQWIWIAFIALLKYIFFLLCEGQWLTICKMNQKDILLCSPWRERERIFKTKHFSSKVEVLYECVCCPVFIAKRLSVFLLLNSLHWLNVRSHMVEFARSNRCRGFFFLKINNKGNIISEGEKNMLWDNWITLYCTRTRWFLFLYRNIAFQRWGRGKTEFTDKRGKAHVVILPESVCGMSAKLTLWSNHFTTTGRKNDQ